MLSFSLSSSVSRCLLLLQLVLLEFDLGDEEGGSWEDGWEDWDNGNWVEGTGVDQGGTEAETGAGAEAEAEPTPTEP